jgi:ribosomal protein S18 acetylase RimI-like enzyme
MHVVPERARRADAVEIERLRDAAAKWLLSRGIEQWAVGEIDTATFEAQIAAGDWHVIRSGSRVLACLRLLWEDTSVWGDVAPVAGYVHGLTTDREYGRGLGGALLDWAGDEVARRGRSLLRLDCQEHDHRLRAYYQRLGFDEVGRTEFGPDHPWRPTIRFERCEDRRAPGNGAHAARAGRAAHAAGRRS